MKYFFTLKIEGNFPGSQEQVTVEISEAQYDQIREKYQVYG